MVTPAPIRIEISGGAEVVIEWDDGTTATFAAADLRASCPCAGCREPSGRQQTDLVIHGAVPVTITEARLVGAYAVNLVFAPDQHGTGIYPFSQLYEIGDDRKPSN